MVLCRDYQFSTRRACGLIGFSRSSNEYRGRPDRHARIRERLVTLSGKHRRYGYRMLHAKLGQEGFKVNVKVVERLYREERLTLRRRNRKKIPKGVREGAWCPIAANQRWSLDFTMDACIFRDIRPPIPTTSAHLYRGIRPALTRCREALVFDISFLAFRHVVEGLSFGRIVRRVRAGRRCAPAGRGWHLRRWVHQ